MYDFIDIAKAREELIEPVADEGQVEWPDMTQHDAENVDRAIVNMESIETMINIIIRVLQILL